MTTTNLWVNVNTWIEVEQVLKSYDLKPCTLIEWIVVRRTRLVNLSKQLRCGECSIDDANECEILGQGRMGTWTYSPDGGLQPIDYWALRPALANRPIELDTVFKGVLESCLVHHGQPIELVKRVTDSLPWCEDSKVESCALQIESLAWDTITERFVTLIHKERAKATRSPQEPISPIDTALRQIRQILVELVIPCVPITARPQPIDEPEYMSPVDIAKRARAAGYDADYRNLCKVRNMQDNGEKGKGRRKLLVSAAMSWIEKHCPRLLQTPLTGYYTPPAQPATPLTVCCPTAPLIDKITAFLQAHGPAKALAISDAINESVGDVASVLRTNQAIFEEYGDGVWKLR